MSRLRNNHNDLRRSARYKASLPEMPPLSGLQRDVLSLYRLVLRVGRAKNSVSYASEQFRTDAASVSRMDFKKVEYMLRRGHKRVKMMGMDGVKVVGGTSVGGGGG